MQIFYTVRSGDTLYNIAARWNIPLLSLIKANNLPAPYIIYIGQQLSMPPGVTSYVVKAGESVFSISQKYKVPANQIIYANGLEPPYMLITGQLLTIPQGVPYYIIRPGDTLYKIALRYNVVVKGQPRADLIIKANPGLTPSIWPGLSISIPFPPPGGTGRLAVLLNDEIKSYLGLYETSNGSLNTMPINEADETSRIFWSPRQDRIAYVDKSGTISIIDLPTMKVSKIDQTSVPGFIDWSPDGKRIVYSNDKVIKIYNLLENSSKPINRLGTLYVQWFPNETELLFEAKDKSNISQLYRINADGSGEVQITRNNAGLLNYVRLSPNGKFVLYTTPGASISEIYTIELLTGNIYKIPGGPEAKNYYPAWSPDSRKIAYSSTSFINGKYYSLIRVSGAKGENDNTIAVASCYSTPVSWSPNSRKIAYLSGCRYENLPVEVWSIDLEKPVPINISYGFIYYTIDWSPAR